VDRVIRVIRRLAPGLQQLRAQLEHHAICAGGVQRGQSRRHAGEEGSHARFALGVTALQRLLEALRDVVDAAGRGGCGALHSAGRAKLKWLVVR
jgi:hypothetical protein